MIILDMKNYTHEIVLKIFSNTILNIGTDYSTKFSPWLSLGCLSPRRIHWEIEKYEQERTKNDSTYWVRFELIWRDYFKFVSMKYGDRIFYPSGMKGRHIVWKKDKELFQAWRRELLFLELTFD